MGIDFIGNTFNFFSNYNSGIFNWILERSRLIRTLSVNKKSIHYDMGSYWKLLDIGDSLKINYKKHTINCDEEWR